MSFKKVNCDLDILPFYLVFATLKIGGIYGGAIFWGILKRVLVIG
jgi:hypothetical protein